MDLDALARRIADELARGDRLTSFPSSTRSHSGGAGRNGSPPPGVAWVRENARIADFIDHTLLKAEATEREVDQLCTEALEHRFAAVCINPIWVPLCATRLAGSAVRIATVVGFPLGASHSATKAAEASRAVSEGATEVDMVASIGHIRSADWGHVADDIAAVVHAAVEGEGRGRGKGRGAIVKVIIESATLTPVEVIKACALAREAGAHYVKTSTGFHPAGGATAEAIALMRLVVGDALGVKASGGVRDCAAALRMIAAGATRIGTSSGVAMAKCLGPGPLPLAELLAAPHEHAHSCTTCSAPSAEPAATSGPY